MREDCPTAEIFRLNDHLVRNERCSVKFLDFIFSTRHGVLITFILLTAQTAMKTRVPNDAQSEMSSNADHAKYGTKKHTAE
jgi:hypothetical protein